MLANSIAPDDYNSQYNVHKLTNRYYMHIKGSELIMHEFKEIMLEISILIKEKQAAEAPPGKSILDHLSLNL